MVNKASLGRRLRSSAPPDERHFSGGNGQELDIGVERESRHIENGGSDVMRVEGWFCDY